MKHILNIDHHLVSGDLYKVADRIYAVEIPDQYQRGMLFCCFQEYYESPYKEIHGKSFTIGELMDVYRKKRKSLTFTYPEDWEGYNIPSAIIQRALPIVNAGDYNYTMEEIYEACENDCNDIFYIIGVDKIGSEIYNHELAHGLYYTNISYKKEMNKLIREMDDVLFENMRDEFIKMGYSKKKELIYDEIQAHLCEDGDRPYKNHFQLFTQVFNKYKNQ